MVLHLIVSKSRVRWIVPKQVNDSTLYIWSCKKSSNLQKGQMILPTHHHEHICTQLYNLHLWLVEDKKLLRHLAGTYLNRRLENTIPILPTLSSSIAASLRRKEQRFVPEMNFVGIIHATLGSFAVTNGEHYSPYWAKELAPSNQFFNGVRNLPDSLFLLFDILEQNMDISKNADSINRLK